MKKIETDERSMHLEQCYADGLAIANGLVTVWTLFANKCCGLLIDKPALAAFSEPVGWSGAAWGKAAYRFPDWFDSSRESITASQLMTLAYFGSISEDKSEMLYSRWVEEGANWELATVRERCEELAERRKRGSAIKIRANIKFKKRDKQIVAAPEDKFAWDRSNGEYTITLKKEKE